MKGCYFCNKVTSNINTYSHHLKNDNIEHFFIDICDQCVENAKAITSILYSEPVQYFYYERLYGLEELSNKCELPKSEPVQYFYEDDDEGEGDKLLKAIHDVTKRY